MSTSKYKLVWTLQLWFSLHRSATTKLTSTWNSLPRATWLKTIDEFQINEINVDLRTSGFDNEVLSVDACAVW